MYTGFQKQAPTKSDAHQPTSQFKNNYFTEMCSGSEAGSYLRLVDFVYHSTLGLRVIKKKRTNATFHKVTLQFQHRQNARRCRFVSVTIRSDTFLTELPSIEIKHLSGIDLAEPPLWNLVA